MVGFTLGLLTTIQDSVSLEFDRPRVFRTQQALAQILDRSVDGWHVKLVRPIELYANGVIRMQLAQGQPARLVPEPIYSTSMTAAATVITDHLQRKGDGDEYYADSDFHDGQAFIDARTHRVWLIDPGQAIEVSPGEHYVADFIVRVLARTMTVNMAVDALNRSPLNPHAGERFYTAKELEAILVHKDRADAFIRSVSLTVEKGSYVSLPTVQWVLGMNRQLALSRKIGTHLDRSLWWNGIKQSAREFLKFGAKRLGF